MKILYLPWKVNPTSKTVILNLFYVILPQLIIITVLMPPLQGEGLLDLDCQVKHSWCEYQGWEQL